MQALIFANGEYQQPKGMDALRAASELVIAADGGSRHALDAGMTPDVVIGDMDSLGAEQRSKLAKSHLIQHPEDKDRTDLELALRHAAKAGAERALVLAGLGRRWDHSLANLLLPLLPELKDLQVVFLHGEQRLFLIREEAALEAEIGARVSLLPIGGDADGVETRGLRYPLEQETLRMGSSRGVSNVVLGADARVSLKSGVLLCVVSPADLD